MPIPPFVEEEEPGIGSRLLGGLEYLGASLDKAFGARALRGGLTGDLREVASIIPFSDALGITDYEDVVGGREFLERTNVLGPNTPGLDVGDVAGFAFEVGTDPGTYLTGGLGALTKGGRAVKNLGSIAGKADELADIAKGTRTLADEYAAKVAAMGDDASPAMRANVEKAENIARMRQEAADEARKAYDTLQAEAGGVTELAPTLEERIAKDQASLFEIGVPFTKYRKPIGTGETAQAFARNVVDPAGDWVRYGPIGSTLGPLFRWQQKGASTREGIELAEEATRKQGLREADLGGEAVDLKEEIDLLQDHINATPRRDPIDDATFAAFTASNTVPPEVLDNIAAKIPGPLSPRERAIYDSHSEAIEQLLRRRQAAEAPDIKVDPGDAGRAEPPLYDDPAFDPYALTDDAVERQLPQLESNDLIELVDTPEVGPSLPAFGQITRDLRAAPQQPAQAILPAPWDDIGRQFEELSDDDIAEFAQAVERIKATPGQTLWDDPAEAAAELTPAQQEAFAKADWDGLQKKVLRFAKKSLQQADAEETAQNAVVKAMEKFHQFDPTKVKDGKPDGWLVGIARREIANIARNIKKAGKQADVGDEGEDLLEATVAAETKAAPDIVQGLEETTELHEALGRLSDEEQMLVQLRYLDGKTAKEVGAELGISGNAAGIRARKAFKKLTNELNQPAGEARVVEQAAPSAAAPPPPATLPPSRGEAPATPGSLRPAAPAAPPPGAIETPPAPAPPAARPVDPELEALRSDVAELNVAQAPQREITTAAPRFSGQSQGPIPLPPKGPQVVDEAAAAAKAKQVEAVGEEVAPSMADAVRPADETKRAVGAVLESSRRARQPSTAEILEFQRRATAKAVPDPKITKGLRKSATPETKQKLADLVAASEIMGVSADEAASVFRYFDAAFENVGSWSGKKADEYWAKVSFTNEPRSAKTVKKLADAASPEMRLRGAMDLLEDGTAVIQLFENGRVSTAIHEMAHFLRTQMEPEDLKVIEEFVGVKGGKWTTAADEKFARAVEEYSRSGVLPEGVKPRSAIAKVIQKVAEAMRKIYKSVVPGIDMTPESRQFFDAVFTGGPRPAAIAATQSVPGLPAMTKAQIKELADLGWDETSATAEHIALARQAIQNKQATGSYGLRDLDLLDWERHRVGQIISRMEKNADFASVAQAAQEIPSPRAQQSEDIASEAARIADDTAEAVAEAEPDDLFMRSDDAGPPPAPDVPNPPPPEAPNVRAAADDALPGAVDLNRVLRRMAEDKELTNAMKEAIGENMPQVRALADRMKKRIYQQGEDFIESGLLDEDVVEAARAKGYFPRFSGFYDNPAMRKVLEFLSKGKKADGPLAHSRFAQSLQAREAPLWEFAEGTDGINEFVRKHAGDKKVTAAQARQYLIEGGSDGMDEAVAEWVKKLPKKLQGQDLFDRQVYDDFHLSMQQGGRAIANAQSVQKLFVTTAGAGDDAVDMASALKAAGLKNNDRVLSAILRDNAEVLAEQGVENIEQLKKLQVPQTSINEAQRMIRQHKGLEEIEPLLRAWDRYTDLFKDAVTIAWPAFHARNALSGLFMNFATGAFKSPGDVKFIKRALDMYNGKGDPRMIREVAVNNVAGRNYGIRGQGARQTDQAYKVPEIEGATGLGSTYRRYREAADLEGGFKEVKNAEGEVEATTSNVPRPFRAWKAGGQALADMIEYVNRVSNYLAHRSRGVAPYEAAQNAVGAHFNYTDSMTRFERGTMRRLVPFYTFAKSNLPLQVELILQRPGGLTGQMLRAARIGREEGGVPEWVTGVAAAFPESEDDGSQRYLSGLGIPIEEATERFGFGPGGARKTVESHLGMLHPFVKMPLELLSGRQFFSGRDLEDLYSTTGSTLGDQLLYNLPIARAVTTGRTLLDERKGLGTKALNTLTGVKITDVDTERVKAAERREAIERFLRNSPNIGKFERLYKKKDAELTPEEQRALEAYKER